MRKKEFRGLLLAQRRNVTDADRDAIVSGLFQWLSMRLPGTAAAYHAMSDEVDLSALYERLPGWRWVFPRLEPDGTISFRDLGVPTETHPLGMTQPVAAGSTVPLHEIDIFLVPGVAFDRSGMRMGRGGGHYDRILSGRRSDAVSIGIGPPHTLVAEVPSDTHDVAMEFVARLDGVSEVG